jgi:hypothetical protein
MSRRRRFPRSWPIDCRPRLRKSQFSVPPGRTQVRGAGLPRPGEPRPPGPRRRAAPLLPARIPRHAGLCAGSAPGLAGHPLMSAPKCHRPDAYSVTNCPQLTPRIEHGLVDRVAAGQARPSGPPAARHSARSQRRPAAGGASDPPPLHDAPRRPDPATLPPGRGVPARNRSGSRSQSLAAIAIPMARNV